MQSCTCFQFLQLMWPYLLDKGDEIAEEEKVFERKDRVS